MTYLSQTRKTQKSYRSQREKMKHRTKLFYKNAVKEYYVLREIYGEDKLPISNITRMDKIVDK